MLYIIRHGKTDWNALVKLQGRTDIPLNDEGRRMAMEAREEYKDINFDVCYCSPLIRAKETAEILLEGRDIEIIPDDRLNEMAFGIYEGIEESLAKPDCPINVLFKDPANYVADGGVETWEEIFSRTGDFLKNVAYPLVEAGKDVLIVGHGAMNSCIVTQVKDWGLEHYWDAGIPNCKLMKLI